MKLTITDTPITIENEKYLSKEELKKYITKLKTKKPIQIDKYIDKTTVWFKVKDTYFTIQMPKEITNTKELEILASTQLTEYLEKYLEP